MGRAQEIDGAQRHLVALDLDDLVRLVRPLEELGLLWHHQELSIAVTGDEILELAADPLGAAVQIVVRRCHLPDLLG